MKLGKKPPKFDHRTLLFGKYTLAGLPPPPPVVDYSRKVTSWPMMKNDTYGDCTCAAAGHMIEEWTANTASKPLIVSDQQILAAYNHFAHGNPDAGANMLDVLNYWRHTGIGQDKITAYVQLEPQNDVQVRDSVYLFGSCYIGVALPDFAVPPGVDPLTVPWVVPPQGPVGNAKPDPNNGHCIPAVGYDQRNLYVVTWGALKPMSWQFYDTYMDEAYAVLSRDWIDKKLKKAPPGFDMVTLDKDLSAIVGQKVSLMADTKAKVKAKAKVKQR
jgi:hypothetical protein